MKLICQRESLLQGCQLASSVLPTKDIKPILANIKIVAEAGRVTLQATDLELGLRLEVAGVTVLEPGQALLPAARIVSILREARMPELEFESAVGGLTVSGGSLEYELPYEDPEQFPDLPELDAAGAAQLTAGPLREMIRRTTFACATETARFTMTGVYWSLETDGTARLVATDGRRLAMSTGAVTGVSTAMTAIVPSKAMHALERNLLDDEEPSFEARPLGDFDFSAMGAPVRASRPSPASLPAPLAEVIGKPISELDWISTLPGMKEYPVPGWPQARLVRLAAGRTIPPTGSRTGPTPTGGPKKLPTAP
jgi:DNA polymerase III beta subunit